MNSSRGGGSAFWICAWFTFFSSLIGLTFSLLSLRMVTGHEYALYAASRSIALSLATLLAMVLRSRGGVEVLAVALTLVQLGDGIVGFLVHDPGRAYAPLAVSVLNASLLFWLRRSEARSVAAYHTA